MMLLPYRAYAIATPLATRDAAERLRGLVEPRHFWRRNGAHRDFEGEVSDSGFRISPIYRAQTSFLPELHGRFEAAGDGTRLTVQATPSTAVLLLVTILLGFLAMLVFDGNTPRVWLATAATALVAWLLATAGLWFDGQRS